MQCLGCEHKLGLIDVTDLNTNLGSGFVHSSSWWSVYRLKMEKSNRHNPVLFLTNILHSRVILPA